MIILQVQVFVGQGSKERSLNFQKGASYIYTLIMLEYDFYLKKKKNMLTFKFVNYQTCTIKFTPF